MISLLRLLKEIQEKPKAIIMAGAAGSGKSYISNNFLGKTSNGIFKPKNSNIEFKYMNPDEYIEKQNLPLANAMQKFRGEFQNTQDEKQNIFWDTTAANIKNTLSQLQDYDKFMVMVYTHPIVSIIQNAKRDRTLPLEAVIKIWDSVYSNIEEYKKYFGNNFNLIQNIPPGFEKPIKEFNEAVKNGKNSLKIYLEKLTSSDPELFKSSFDKPFSFSSKEIEQAFEDTLKQSSYNENKDKNILKTVKKEFEKEYQKQNKNPGVEFLDKKIKSTIDNKNKNTQNYEESLEQITNKLVSPQFKKIISPNTPEEIQNKLNNFLN